MRIKQIELNGFKSFMERTVLELPAGVTAIVGPNGNILAGTKSYGAYRIRDKAGSARRLSGALRIPATGTTADSIRLPAYSLQAKSSKHVVLDAALDDLSKEQLVAIVDWSTTACDVVAIAKHTPIEWEVAPGTPTRVSRLDFT